MKENEKKDLGEAGAVAFVDLYTTTGDKVGLTCRANTGVDALDELMYTLSHAKEAHNLYLRNDATDPEIVTELPAPDKDFGWLPADERGPKSDGQDDFFVPPDTPSGDVSDSPAILGTHHGMVKWLPLAPERGFGDRWDVRVNKYKAKDHEIQFWNDDSQYAIIKHSVKHEIGRNKFVELFEDWKPVSDGEFHDFDKPIIIELQATGPERKNQKGYPWVNLDGIRRE